MLIQDNEQGIGHENLCIGLTVILYRAFPSWGPNQTL